MKTARELLRYRRSVFFGYRANGRARAWRIANFKTRSLITILREGA